MQVELFVISHHNVQKLQQRCPNLETVELLIPRTRGDRHEVEIYHALGRLSRLKRASLLLDCSNLNCQQTRLMDRSDAEEDNNEMMNLVGVGIPFSLVRSTFINAAVDSFLALSIFRTISTINTLAYPTKDPSLQYLKLKVEGGGSFGQGMTDCNIENIMTWLGRCWVCERDQRCDYDWETSVREMGKRQRKKVKEKLEHSMKDENGIHDRVWKNLWPERTGDWMENWSSFPLSNSLS